MSKTVRYSVDSVTHYVRDLGTLDTRFFRIHERGTSCPLCQLEFKVGDKYTLVANNFIAFPNIGVHTECFMGKGSINKIHKDYKMFKEFEAKYKHWI